MFLFTFDTNCNKRNFLAFILYNARDKNNKLLIQVTHIANISKFLSSLHAINLLRYFFMSLKIEFIGMKKKKSFWTVKLQSC